jgi:hypothetical protein
VHPIAYKLFDLRGRNPQRGGVLGPRHESTGAEWFVGDSPVEEGVLSEPVSEPKFPASWENTGNFIDSGLGDASTVAKPNFDQILN